MSVVLGIDTATAVSAGVARYGEIVAARTLSGTHHHVEFLQPTISDVLASCRLRLTDVTDIAVGMGPGPFTGLRVGIATAQILAEALDVPLHRVCTLDVLAAQWLEAPAEFVVVTDARRHEVYWARYRDGVRIGNLQVTAPDKVPSLAAAGPGVDLCPQLELGADAPTEVSAGVLAACAASLPDPGPQPLYLRRPDATVPTRRKSVLVVPGRRK